MHRPSLLNRVFGFAILATVLFATLGASAHREHGPGSDAACVVHQWMHAVKSAALSSPVALTLSFSFSDAHLSHSPIAVAHPSLRAATARAPPLA